ncbi:MAG: sigma-70 family RNA polymerase sigma factor [Gemmatimonadales bacterium]|nr:MAG: sigma-70 family RNA polymerase sigma factor [Gemmatimonadales bacterium]
MNASAAHDDTFEAEALPQMDAVYRFALRLSKSEDRAQDLTQETFLRAYQNWEKYTQGTKVKSWLFTICRNLFLRTEERGKRHDEIVTGVADTDPRQISREATVFMAVRDRDPEGHFWREMVDARVLEAIDDLPDEFREAVILSDLEGLPYQEVAEIVDVPVGTVKSRLFRGRRILQEALYEYAVEEGIIGEPTAARIRNRGEASK